MKQTNYMAVIEKWLSETLADLPGVLGGVHNTIAVEDAPAPYVLFTLQTSDTETVLCGDTVAVRAMYALRVIGMETGYEPLTETETAILERLEGATATIDDAALSVTLTEPLRRFTVGANGAHYYESGGLFTVLLTP